LQCLFVDLFFSYRAIIVSTTLDDSLARLFTRNDTLVVLTIDITGPKPLARLKYWFALIQVRSSYSCITFFF
jgi:hypothetical protein